MNGSEGPERQDERSKQDTTGRWSGIKIYSKRHFGILAKATFDRSDQDVGPAFNSLRWDYSRHCGLLELEESTSSRGGGLAPDY